MLQCKIMKLRNVAQKAVKEVGYENRSWMRKLTKSMRCSTSTNAQFAALLAVVSAL